MFKQHKFVELLNKAMRAIYCHRALYLALAICYLFGHDWLVELWRERTIALFYFLLSTKR